MVQLQGKRKAKVTAKVVKKQVKPTVKEETQEEEQDEIESEEKVMAITTDADDKNQDEDHDAEESEDAGKTMKRMREDDQEVGGKKSKTEAIPNKILYVKGVTKDMSLDEFSKYFEDAESLNITRTLLSGKGLEENSDEASRTLCVKNMPYSATEEEVMALFENLKEVRLPRSKKKRKGIGFVEFLSAAALDKAMETEDKYELEGRKLLLDYTDSRSRRPGTHISMRLQKRDVAVGHIPQIANSLSARNNTHCAGKVLKEKMHVDSRTLYVTNVPYNTTEAVVMALFENVKEVRLPRVGERGKGIAFVEFRSAVALDKAMETKDKYELDGRKLSLNYIDGRGQRPGIGTELASNQGNVLEENSDKYSRTLLVKNTPYDTTTSAVMELFENVEAVRLPHDGEKGRGIAFVQFCSTAAFDKAMETKDKYELGGRKLSLEKAMDPRGQRPGIYTECVSSQENRPRSRSKSGGRRGTRGGGRGNIGRGRGNRGRGRGNRGRGRGNVGRGR